MLTPEEQAELDSLNKELGPPKAGGLTPEEQAELDLLNKELGPPKAEATAPAYEGPSRLKGAAEAVIPGGQSYEVAQNPNATFADKLGAGSADLLNLGLAIGTGGGWPLAKQAMVSAAGGAVAPEMAKLSAYGSEQGKQAVQNWMGNPDVGPQSGSMLAQVGKRLPETLGDIVGSALPQAALLLMGKAAKKYAPAAPEVQPLTPQQLAAKELQGAGYPVTPSHVSGGTELKAAMGLPSVSGEAEAYKTKLGTAMREDVGKALGVGSETTQTLGEKAKTAFNQGLGERSTTYRQMLEAADNPRGVHNTGIGEFTHAGKEFASQEMADLAAKGLQVTPDLKAKALIGGGLSSYDVPAGVNPADATTAIKFADLASQKAPSVVQLDALARDFAKTEGLFKDGSASSSGFLQKIQRRATDIAGEILKAQDANNPEQTPVYPQWAEQKANWAKTADLVNQFREKLGSKTTRLTGEAMYSADAISPEQIFQKEFANAGVSKIQAFKDFLKTNKQDPAIIENMAKDWLNDIGSKGATPEASFNAIEKAWRGLSPERKAALFPMSAGEIDAALGRGKAARAPLEVMGTKMSGESQTASKLAIAKDALKHGMGAKVGSLGAAGAYLGTAAGGPIGGAIGGGIGALGGMTLQNLQELAQKANAQRAMLPPTLEPTMSPDARFGSTRRGIASVAPNALQAAGMAAPGMTQQDMLKRAAALTQSLRNR